MAKFRRNQRCPCGSGKKFKHCHGGINHPTLDAEVERRLREIEAARIQRERQQGVGRGIVSAELAGRRLVAVGSTVHHSTNWKTFQDFLRHYLIVTLGRDWFKAEYGKPLGEQHPIVRWYSKFVVEFKRGTKVGDIVSGPMTGAQRAFLNLAYNIYLIAHHAEPAEAKALLRVFIDKLKSERSDDFIGKLFETYAAAAFLKAGFSIAYEDESIGGKTHVEFVATYPKTGRKFSVEVKSRNRESSLDGPKDDIKRLRVANKLNKALAKKADHTRVVMIEVNVPDLVTGQMLEGWPRAALEQVRHAEKTDAQDGLEKPSAYVIVTNHAFHNNLDAAVTDMQMLAVGCKIPDFGPDVTFNRLKDWLDSKDKHREILALLDSMTTHYDIPATFDGEIPELAFQLPEAPPRLKFGNQYLIPGPNGEEVSGRLYDAVVNEIDKVVMGVYETADGRHLMVSSPLTDAELAGWKKHPDTFFGEVRHVGGTVNNWLELAEFFFETYQHTPSEKLLEWMKDAPDIAELRSLPQRDLAIVYCERTALAKERNKVA